MKLRSFLFVLILILVFSNTSYASEDQHKAEEFEKILSEPIWIEKTTYNEEDVDKARKWCESLAKFEAMKTLRERVIQDELLGIKRETFDIGSTIVIQEDYTGNYGKPILTEINGRTISQITFRFLIGCEDVKGKNPFINKTAYNKPSIVNIHYNLDDWEIEARVFGFYENFNEDVDTKVMIARKISINSGCEAIIKRIRELGIAEIDVQNKIIKAIKFKRDYGGVYHVRGCGVEVEVPVIFTINKNSGAIHFKYGVTPNLE